MDILLRSPSSPLHASIRCAVLRNKPPTDGDAVLSCARAKGVTALWVGTAASLALFAYRAMALRKQEGQPPPREPFAWYVPLLPFVVASAYMLITPLLAFTSFEADRQAFEQSKMTPTEWMAARANDERTLKTTNTSIFCACIVASAGFLNSQLAYSRSVAAAAAAAKASAARLQSDPSSTALTAPPIPPGQYAPAPVDSGANRGADVEF
jgi:hypothetical protein